MMMTMAACDACSLAAASAAAGGVVECVCGVVHGSAPDDTRPWRRQEPVQRPREGRVWRAPVGDPDGAPAAPLARQGAAATALRAEDPEVARVRRLLADLRPDAADPWVRLAAPVETTPAGAMPRDPSASWGGIPRGLLSGGAEAAAAAAAAASRRCVAEVLAELALLPPDAGAVLRWLRELGDLRAGLRGLYADVGVAFASDDQAEAWRDLGARREGAPAWGRRLVLRAAEAWGR